MCTGLVARALGSSVSSQSSNRATKTHLGPERIAHVACTADTPSDRARVLPGQYVRRCRGLAIQAAALFIFIGEALLLLVGMVHLAHALDVLGSS